MEIIDAIDGDGLFLRLAQAGSNMLARIEMMVMTTKSSIRVKPGRFALMRLSNLPSAI